MASEMPRRVPAIISYLHPFRIIRGAESGEWPVTIENVNCGTWDYVELHKIVGGIDIGLPAPYHLIVGRDGALALPPIPELRADQQAVEFFNRCLAALLLGGVYCEAVTLDNVEVGSIIDWTYIRSTRAGAGAPNQFHNHIRMQAASSIEAISLYQPRELRIEEMVAAAKAGLAVIDAIPSLAPEFLLKGVTGIARRDWGAGLANLWIAVEQVTAYLWGKKIIEDSKVQIPGRLDQLKDNRSWSIAARHELLFQKSIINEETFRDLFISRKARNDLAHNGRHPSEQAAKSCFEALRGLMSVTLAERELPLFELDLAMHELSDPFRPGPDGIFNPQYWMEIPKLPGEAELEKEEAASHGSNSES